MAQEEEKAVVDQANEAPQPQAEEEAALAEELEEEFLEQVTGGGRTVGGVMKYAEGEREFLLCKQSRNPFGKHKWKVMGTTQRHNGLYYQDAEEIKCIWCGYTWYKYK